MRGRLLLGGVHELLPKARAGAVAVCLGDLHLALAGVVHGIAAIVAAALTGSQRQGQTAAAARLGGLLQGLAQLA